MNQLSSVGRLANRYYGMRHGESKANVAGLIVSRIETDRSGDYGLSERGRRQAVEAARDCGLTAQTMICSSDFARAWQTAQIVRERLGVAEVVAAAALRERCFGDLEGTPVAGYARVWAVDEGDMAGGSPAGGQAGGPAPNGVEPVAAVLDRSTGLILEMERRHSGRDVLLVSHGDTLAILQAGFLGMDPAGHRSLPPFGTAEIRPLRDRRGRGFAEPRTRSG